MGRYVYKHRLIIRDLLVHLGGNLHTCTQCSFCYQCLKGLQQVSHLLRQHMGALWQKDAACRQFWHVCPDFSNVLGLSTMSIYIYIYIHTRALSTASERATWERASGHVFSCNLSRNYKKMQFFITKDCDANAVNGPLLGPLRRFQVVPSLSTNHWRLLVAEPFAAINDLRSRRAVLATVLGPGSSWLLDVAVQTVDVPSRLPSQDLTLIQRSQDITQD